MDCCTVWLFSFVIMFFCDHLHRVFWWTSSEQCCLSDYDHTQVTEFTRVCVSFVSSLLIVQTYIATLYLRQKCTSTGELVSESFQRRIVPNNSSTFVCSRIFRAFELELSTSMLALREVWLLQKLPNYRGYSHANGGSTSPARATWGIVCCPPGSLLIYFVDIEYVESPVLSTWDRYLKFYKIGSPYLFLFFLNFSDTKKPAVADWGSRQVFTIHSRESQGNPSQPYRGGTRTGSSTCGAHRVGIQSEYRATWPFLFLFGSAQFVSPWRPCSRRFPATPVFPNIRHLITKELSHQPDCETRGQWRCVWELWAPGFYR